MSPTITITGLTTNGAITDAQTVQPFNSVAVTDSITGDLVSATISFTAANGALAGAGLSTGVASGGSETYTLAATTQLALQAELQGLTFTPTAHQAALGTQVTTAFDLTVTDVTDLAPVATPTLLRTLPSVVSPAGVATGGVATDAAGDVFVANYGNSTVAEFNASGDLVRTLTNGVGLPVSLATDAAGDVFVANGNNTVEKFNASGTLIATLSTGVSGPISVATDAAGDVFVANGQSNTVEEFNASGSLLRTMSSGVNAPKSLVTDAAGDVFVANANTVEEFDASGALVHTLSSGVSSPYGLATDSAGDVYVANFGNNTVEKFNASGTLIATLSNGVSGPISVATDAAGDVFVGNLMNGTVEKFNASGALVATLSEGVGLPVGLATDAAGDLFVGNKDSWVEDFTFSQMTSINDSTTQVAVTQAAGAATITIAGLTTNGAITDAQTAQPFGSVTITDSISGDLVSATISFTAANGSLAGAGLSAGVASGGTVTYALSATTQSALQTELHGLTFTPTAHQAAPGTQVTTTFDLTVTDVTDLSPAATLSSGVSSPYSVAIDASGDVFVANSGINTVEEFSGSGTLLRTMSTGPSSAPCRLATDTAGDVFVANSGNNTVEEFSGSGALLRTMSSGINAPKSVATDAIGDLFVANSGNNTVEEFSGSGALLRTMSNGVSIPVGLATDAAGDVFVANSGNNTVEEFSGSGILLRTLSSGVSGPYGLATDAAGDVFVANVNNNTVEEFNASGVQIATLSSGVNAPISVAIDASGNVFVANANTVEEFNASGSLVHTLSSGVSAPTGLATNAAGDVFIANWGNNTVEEFAPAHLTSVSNTTTQTVSCFCAGTLVTTAHGARPVEDLVIGELLQTTSREIRPITWIGRRTVAAAFSDPVRCWPIRVKAGALAENVPARDLLLSPDHALLVNDVLIQAGALVNGTSIVHETAVPQKFVYYHVELDDHSLILAENAPAETFVDNVDRMCFDNWAEHEALYPDGKPIEEMSYPRAKARRQVPMHIRAELDARAKAIYPEAVRAVA